MKKLLLLCLIIITGRVFSHPHVFVDYNLELISDSSVKLFWTFDPLVSEQNAYFYDNNNDGELDREEIEILFDESFKKTEEKGYFLIISQGENLYPVKSINDFDIVKEADNRLTYSFTVKIPDLKDGEVVISHFDTTYFTAFNDPDDKEFFLPDNIYSGLRKNRDKPYYYDPVAGIGVVLDTSKPKPGWEKVYPTEVVLSYEKIKNIGINSFSIKEFVIKIQRDLYFTLSNYIVELSNGSSIKIVLLILISLLYGVIHALGPGHRKIAISSYLLSKKRSNYSQAVGLSIASALIHSIAGIGVVMGTYFIFDTVLQSSMNYQFQLIDNISSAILLLLALWLIIKKVVPGKKVKKEDKEELSLIILSSLIPCPGAITIMTVSLTMGILYIGVLSVLAMSVGIGITISVISIISVKSKKVINKSGNLHIKRMKGVIEWAAIGVLIIFSLLTLKI